jgi:hypothetical protein
VPVSWCSPGALVGDCDGKAGSREGSEVECYGCWVLEMEDRLSSSVGTVVGV